jgi:lipopolysaccharide transport system ATP-binding protein
MSDVVIKVESISKQYRLGTTGTGSLAHDFNRWWHQIRGKGDPYLKIGEENDRANKGESQYVWALRDINFEVRHGEVMGIIGRNGAGKSTLLKILSRTTAPTIGEVKIRGRVASLLEVGTGFHPELSGRDNIYLNGAILGMTRLEIKRKFDEIIGFAGIERYVDTPVKRYSSGMYVRLAFAIAAYLDPEILIVDEVLAVGDAEFQRKCIGKMNDVANKEGRTVLFVSHNIGVINQLCKTAVLLKNGLLHSSGETLSVTREYLSSGASSLGEVLLDDRPSAKLTFTRISILDHLEKVNDELDVLQHFHIGLEYTLNDSVDALELAIRFLTNDDVSVFTTCYSDCSDPDKLKTTPGKYSMTVKVPGRFLMPGSYKITVAAYKANQEVYDFRDSILTFNINETGSQFSKYGSQHKVIGLVMKDLTWESMAFSKKIIAS